MTLTVSNAGAAFLSVACICLTFIFTEIFSELVKK